MVGNATVSYVIGTIDGSDEDAGMYLFGAHYDSENRDVYDLSTAESITAPGADDDASGSVALMALARAFALGPKPRRSLVFVWHTGEERGL